MTPEEFAARYQVIGKELTADARKLCIRAALMAEAKGKENAGTILNVRSGRLRASIAGSTRVNEGAFEIVLRAGGEGDADVNYAAAHEYGAVIRPKKGKFLAIPLPIARTPRGVARYQTPRDVPDLHLAQSKRGQYLLVKPDGEPWYQLRQRVVIPRRQFLYPALSATADDLAGKLDRLLAGAI